jgi:hypothetical protein
MNTEPSSTSFLLRIEGVNLFPFIFDTRDLSTARGGSLLLLESVTSARTSLEAVLPGKSVTPISVGASSGLFELTCQPDDASKAAEKLRGHLRKKYPWMYGTFVVDLIPASTDFTADGETLLAANRWRQMQGSTLAVPAVITKVISKPVCKLDGIRPAVAHKNNGAPFRGLDKESFLSPSVRTRRNYGRYAKQKFYRNVIQRVIRRDPRLDFQTLASQLPDFAQSFEDIATHKEHQLSGKLAVFYADGNHFNQKFRQHGNTSPKLQKLDEFLRSQREAFLAAFLNKAVASEDWKGSKGFPFETLLWGGDELMFVMPAHLGWRFAQTYFKHLGGMNLNQVILDDGSRLAADVPLTFAAGLVFCQHHSPIARIKHLVKDELAEFAKSNDRTRHQLVCLALESFDHLGSGYKTTQGLRYNRDSTKPIIDLKELVLPGDPQVLKDIAEHFEALRRSETFARSQLRRLVSTMIAQPAEAAQLASFKDIDGQLQPPRAFRNCDEKAKQGLRALHKIFPNPIALWLQLEELWDYALPCTHSTISTSP